MSSRLGQLDKAVRMEKQQQESNVSRLSLDQRFSNKGHRSSARLRHQSLDRGMDRPSLDQRFGGTGQQIHLMTAPHCRWVQASSADRQPLDQRFSNGNCRLSATRTKQTERLRTGSLQHTTFKQVPAMISALRSRDLRPWDGHWTLMRRIVLQL